MNNRNDDKLSALVDDELGEWELKSVVKALGHDDALRTGWRDYHLIGDAMRGSLPDRLYPELTDRICLALDNEPHHFPSKSAHPAPSPATPGRARAAAGFALAASISAVAVVGIMAIDHDTGAPQSPAMASANEITLSAEARTVLSSLLEDLVAGEPVDAQRPMTGIRTVSAVGSQPMTPDLYEYLRNYQQYSMQGRTDDPLTFLRVVSHGTAP